MSENNETHDKSLLGVGNAAKMREALKMVKRLFDGGIMFQPAIREAHKAVDAALSEPPRNCDVGTVAEQTRRLRANCEKYKPTCKGCEFLTDIRHENCWLKWAQMPYGESEAKE